MSATRFAPRRKARRAPTLGPALRTPCQTFHPMRCHHFLPLAIFLAATPAVSFSGGAIEGQVTLPQRHAAPVMNKRYQIVTEGGHSLHESSSRSGLSGGLLRQTFPCRNRPDGPAGPGLCAHAVAGAGGNQSGIPQLRPDVSQYLLLFPGQAFRPRALPPRRAAGALATLRLWPGWWCCGATSTSTCAA